MPTNSTHTQTITQELNVKLSQIVATAKLLEDGATVPFIARYRKEATGALDEVVVTQVGDRLAQLDALDQRRDAVIKSLKSRELLTPDLAQQLKAATNLNQVEDIAAEIPETRIGPLIAQGELAALINDATDDHSENTINPRFSTKIEDSVKTEVFG